MASGRNPRPAKQSSLDAARRAAEPKQARSYGTAGGTVGDTSTAWSKNKEVIKHGTAGEVKTADALERGLAAGAVAMHDLNIPIPGFKANIDHLVVAGRTVTIIDAKSWAGGFYWTVGGKTRRGSARFEPAEKQTMVLAEKAIRTYLAKKGIEADFNRPVVAVWSTSGHATMWAAKFPGALLINGEKLKRRANRLCGRGDAAPDIVDALLNLVR